MRIYIYNKDSKSPHLRRWKKKNIVVLNNIIYDIVDLLRKRDKLMLGELIFDKQMWLPFII